MKYSWVYHSHESILLEIHIHMTIFQTLYQPFPHRVSTDKWKDAKGESSHLFLAFNLCSFLFIYILFLLVLAFQHQVMDQLGTSFLKYLAWIAESVVPTTATATAIVEQIFLRSLQSSTWPAIQNYINYTKRLTWQNREKERQRSKRAMVNWVSGSNYNW